MLNRFHFDACFLLALAVLTSPATAVIIFPKGDAEPIVGRLLGQEGPKYTVRIALPGGEEITKEFFEAEVDSVLITVSPERLASLSPHTPEAYRDYAEELAEKRKDPDARDAAIRLYLIAAHLDPNRLGRSCLLGMVPLAENDEQARRFRAMAYLLDPQHDPQLLPSKQEASAGGGEDTAEGERILLKAVREFRAGNTRLARTLIDQDRVRRVVARYEDIITYDELYHAEYDTPPSTLYKIIRLELRLARGENTAEDENTEDGTKWSEVAKQGVGAPIKPLTLESLTDIDPKECVFRNGKWTVPNTAAP